jgi:hypothetical protein
MTTIILVAIGVLIAAAAAIMILFYGGDAFGENEIRAEAGRLVSEGQQISYATRLFYQQEERLPGLQPNGTLDGAAGLQELVAKKYIPQLPPGSKLTQEDGWKLEYGTDGMIYSSLGAFDDEASLNVCREARRQLNYNDSQTVYKCDGSDYPYSHPAGTLPDREPCCIKG